MHIHRAERADTLVDALAQLLARPLDDPFAAEVVAVPAKGIERWVIQRLATVLGSATGGDGIAANIEFPDPASLVGAVLAEATGLTPDTDPWAPERLVWTLLPVLDAVLAEPWCGVLSRHLGRGDAAGHKVGRRYATAARIADLFDGYGTQRPGMIAAWADGLDTDGTGRELPEDLRWQPRLWRTLREAVGVPSPAERLSAACAHLRAEPGVVSLPRRISLFGVTRLTTDQLEVLSALSAGREVHLWLVHPSPTLWTELASNGADAQADSADRSGSNAAGDTSASVRAVSDRERVDRADGSSPSSEMPDSLVRVRHPLLAALGRDVRELQQRLHAYDHTDTYHPPAAISPGTTASPGRAERSGARTVEAASDTPELGRPVDSAAGHVIEPTADCAEGGATEFSDVAGSDRGDRAVAAGFVAAATPAVGTGESATGRRSVERGAVAGASSVRGVASGRTLLSALQAAIREDRWPVAVEPELAGDGTVGVHACHGPARQVEVLRDCLLHIFAADHTLQPRDVVVMCPDVESYAPLVRAAFGQWSLDTAEAGHPGHALRVRLADRAQRAVNPLLGVIGTLLELADGRVTVTEVLDLAAAEPVRLRCGFDDDDLERLREWAAETGARWGIGQRQRQAFGLGDFAQNTLNAAVDRILLGVAAGESGADWLDLALPLDDVDSGDIDLAGRFAEFVDRLAVCLRDLRGPTLAEPAGTARPAGEWAAVLGRALDLLTDVTRAQAWTGVQARRELAAALEHAGDVPLRLPDIAALLATRLAGRASRANFRTGELTVCTMVPMRSVPHRVVVLLGLDDEVFPRAGGIDGDDVLARHRCPGDRDPRSEDRQLLLDAIMAAGERLVLLHTGSDPVTGAHRPPAIPLAEVLDTVRAHVGRAAMARIVRRHPLQPFDAANFRADDPFSFDPVALAGAVAARRPQRSRPVFLAAPLPSAAPGDVELTDLVAFAEHPVRAFLWQRLGIRVPEEEEEIDDRLPIALDGLTKWSMGERMLAARLNGVEADMLRAAEWRRGTLPPARMGAAVLDVIEGTVDQLVRVARPMHEIPGRTIDVAVDLGDGRRLTGTVADVHDDALLRATYSRLAPKHRLAAWVRLLALAASGSHQSWRALTLGRGQFRNPVWQSTLTAPDAATARAILRQLVHLRDAGLTEPLPIAPSATAVYADRRCKGASVDDATLSAEQDFDSAYGERTDRYLRQVWGPALRFPDLTRAPAEHGGDEPTRFGELARMLWNPLLANENQGRP
ncbi:exodeoxyribonuclease V subunit gamma [Nocardia otitidiscaviarum]|uniref:exodeoxyribonuclease V subunit gamma n=1 Tax=Nocardia otitidiscaviarum TaxID=1823 RepID=UPI0018950276|nr:exodeoxyribonuclease V subunit gamma [Nocardia otitidiscaviarum]MBF6180368.1 exodeoxyribonuclease V subunit gamma [Nocardia otitidiscaviarum]